MGLSPWFHVLKPHFSGLPLDSALLWGSFWVSSLLSWPKAVEKYFLSSFLIINFFRKPPETRGRELCSHGTASKRRVLAKWGHAGCYSRWTSSPFCFVRGLGSEMGEKTWHMPVSNEKGSVAFVGAGCGGMRIVLTREYWEMDKCRSLSCQSKLLS